MECKQSRNVKGCNCSYGGCSRKGVCCDCLQYHLGMRELPACFFPEAEEKTYNRTFEKFAELVRNKKV